MNNKLNILNNPKFLAMIRVLIDDGETGLAWRVVKVRVKTRLLILKKDRHLARVEKFRVRHEKRWAKLKLETDDVFREMDIFSFRNQIEAFSIMNGIEETS